MRVLAIDPGGTSGYVLGEFDERIEDAFERIKTVEIRDAGEWSGMQDMTDRGIVEPADGSGLFDHGDVVVVERYVIYPNRAQTHIGDDLYTAREIGRIEWLAFTRRDHHEVVFQAASRAKQRWPNDRMYKYFPGAKHVSNHIRDAMRHLMTYVETSQ